MAPFVLAKNCKHATAQTGKHWCCPTREAQQLGWNNITNVDMYPLHPTHAPLHLICLTQGKDAWHSFLLPLGALSAIS